MDTLKFTVRILITQKTRTFYYVSLVLKISMFMKKFHCQLFLSRFLCASLLGLTTCDTADNSGIERIMKSVFVSISAPAFSSCLVWPIHCLLICKKVMNLTWSTLLNLDQESVFLIPVGLITYLI